MDLLVTTSPCSQDRVSWNVTPAQWKHKSNVQCVVNLSDQSAPVFSPESSSALSAPSSRHLAHLAWITPRTAFERMGRSFVTYRGASITAGSPESTGRTDWSRCTWLDWTPSRRRFPSECFPPWLGVSGVLCSNRFLSVYLGKQSNRRGWNWNQPRVDYPNLWFTQINHNIHDL